MAPVKSQKPIAASHAQSTKTLKRKRDEEDLGSLEAKVQEMALKENTFEKFDDLPLSGPTTSGLEASHFSSLTDIQKRAIPLGLRGSDILGAAKTGSGKTLAFLVPVLENLYRKRWTEHDGLGALIISPTRELAIQIFEVLRKIGRFHSFSAGLVIGGKSLQEERDRMGRMNILVCTPGRMLQHLDQTAMFEVDHLQMLVLDEADRIMDLGFQNAIDAIVEHVPKKRQTLLFSATQTKKISDLARLSLQDPEYVAVHNTSESATPASLHQNYIVTPLPHKLDTLWSFLRAHVKSKILVFLSSGKQVRFVYEAFRHMQPGIPLMHLHGRQKQTARLDITKKFSSSKNSCLFATDVVARGLDFPAVDWVIQVDCPEDADTYIHRVGRTARYEREGRAVIFLEPSEEPAMLKRLEQRRIKLEKINVRQKKQQSIKNQLQSMCFTDSELKYLGQKAFVSYVRSVYVQKDKEVFKLDELPLEEFSASLGLVGAPKIKFGQGDTMKKLKNASRQGLQLSDSEAELEDLQMDTEKSTKPEQRTKYDRMFERQNQDVLANHYTKLVDDAALLEQTAISEDEDAGFMSAKRLLSNEPDTDGEKAEVTLAMPEKTAKVITGVTQDALLIDSKRREKLLKSKKKLSKFKEKGKKLVYDDDGNVHEVYELEDEDKFASRGPADAQKSQYRDLEQLKLDAGDVDDKAAEKRKRKEKKLKRKERERAERADGEEQRFAVVQLGTADDDDDRDKSEVDSTELADTEASNVSNRKKRRKADKAQATKVEDQASDSLQDLEAAASGLLG